MDMTRALMLELEEATLTKLAISRSSRIGIRSSFGKLSKRLLAGFVRVVRVAELGRDRRKILVRSGDILDKGILWSRPSMDARLGYGVAVPRILFVHSSELKLSISSMDSCSIC